MCLFVALIDTSCSRPEDQDIKIKSSPVNNSSIHPDNFGKCDFIIDIYSWDKIYFRKPTILGPDLKTYKTDKRTFEKILKEKNSPDQVLAINKHRNCKLSDDEIRQWAEDMGIANIIIRSLPLYLEHEEQKDIKRLQPLAL